MNENPVQRALIGISATAGAEYFRDENNKDILFFADNMYRFVQARNELSTILDQVPNEGGYEPTIFSDVKTLQDRLSSNEHGSITSVQTIYVPADDLSDPAVQMIQHELDSILVLSRKVAEQGIRPAVDLNNTSSSLLTPDIVGDRHYDLSVEVLAMLQKYESLKSIIAIIGENELSPADRADYAKAKLLIKNFTQNMNVMEKHIGIPGETYTREETLKSIEDIISGAVTEESLNKQKEEASKPKDTPTEAKQDTAPPQEKSSEEPAKNQPEEHQEPTEESSEKDKNSKDKKDKKEKKDEKTDEPKEEVADGKERQEAEPGGK